MELTELVHKGERKGIFMDKMPAAIQQVIHAENITFVKNRDIYNHEYFDFIKQLVRQNRVWKTFCCFHFAFFSKTNIYLLHNINLLIVILEI